MMKIEKSPRMGQGGRRSRSEGGNEKYEFESE